MWVCRLLWFQHVFRPHIDNDCVNVIFHDYSSMGSYICRCGLVSRMLGSCRMADVPDTMRALDTTQQRIVTDSRLWWRSKAVCFVVNSLVSVPVSTSVALFHGVGPHTTRWRARKGRASTALFVLSGTNSPSSLSLRSWQSSQSCCFVVV